MPLRYAQHVTWLAAGVQREAALNASGLSECDWMRQAFDKLPPEDAKTTLKQIEAINAHAESCAVCAARETYVDERFGPMPEMPQRWMRIFDWAERLPPWTRPAAFSAMALAAIVSLRLLFAYLLCFSNPGKFGEALIAVFAAAAALNSAICENRFRSTEQTL